MSGDAEGRGAGAGRDIGQSTLNEMMEQVAGQFCDGKVKCHDGRDEPYATAETQRELQGLYSVEDGTHEV